ncbi:MAG: bifunctional folylpolyglutamate synthase/dihydrofolate synthase [Acidobacteria bacterium]|nr:bifunctional folylpolyglutamate synthase/dihydrofolate synthase [Acidobacteriota bacterium]
MGFLVFQIPISDFQFLFSLSVIAAISSSPMDYPETLRYLESLGHELRGVRFRLETIEAVLSRLGAPHLKYGTAIVAGTNGKGSTAAFLSTIVQQAGYRTGLYTSPHLIRVNERIRVDGSEISDIQFARAFTEVKEAVEELVAKGVLESAPSFFEFLTAAAFVHFASVEAEFVVLEVGMGGRLDATNVTKPRVAVITQIDFDHQEYLGSTLAEIAGEKAGVIKPGQLVVSAATRPEASEVIRHRSLQVNAPLIEIACDGVITHLKSRHGQYSFDFTIGGERLEGLTSPLAGRFQVENAAAAVAAAWHLGREGMHRITRYTILEGLRRTSWPGRIETICASPEFLLDGAHNPAGARGIADFTREHLSCRKLRLVYGSMKDKAVAEITELLWPLADEVYLTQPNHARAASPEEVLALARLRPKSLIIEPAAARAAARALAASAAEDVVLVTGSLFLVGEIKKALLDGSLQIPSETARESLVRV